MTDPENTADSHCEQCRDKVLEALYQLNVEAKKYANGAESAYSSGLKTSARTRSLRKKALYGLKTTILRDFVESGCVDSVECHEINGESYYCFYISDFSFHSPVSDWEQVPVDDVSPSSSETLDSFDADPETRSDAMAAHDALARLSEEFESPNNYLEEPFVHSDFSSKFAGWSSLPGAVREHDRVDGRFGRDPESPEKSPASNAPFLFEVGDSFQTRRRGECLIQDRYRAWMAPLMDQSPIVPRAVYDVVIGDEQRKTVLEKRIMDDWGIMVESLEDPLPGVTGEQADIVGDAVDYPIEFDIGDIIELQLGEDSDSVFCRVKEASVSYNLILCEFNAVGPTETELMGRAVSEFADDVIAVHDEPPDSGE